jgi:hypothetical protein
MLVIGYGRFIAKLYFGSQCNDSTPTQPYSSNVMSRVFTVHSSIINLLSLYEIAKINIVTNVTLRVYRLAKIQVDQNKLASLNNALQNPVKFKHLVSDT